MRWQQRGVRADRSAGLDHGLREGFRILPAARKAIVGEGGVRADEDVVVQAHAVPQLDAALDRDPVAQNHAAFDENEVADVGLAPHHRPGQHVGKGPDPRAGADLLGLADALGMNEDVLGPAHQ